MRTWPLERTPKGHLTPACLNRIQSELPAALDRKPWQPQGEAWCALPASGVVLRRWSLPRAAASELPRLLRLQIETELPLSPDDLAWGWLPLGDHDGRQEILVAALKRDTVEEYEQLLGPCGLRPAFTLAALAREALSSASQLCGAGVSPAPGPALPPEGAAGVSPAPHPRLAAGVGPSPARPSSRLTVGLTHSEWLLVDDVGPRQLRALPWGEQELLRTLVAQAGLSPEAAAAEIASLQTNPDPDLSSRPALAQAVETGLDRLLSWLPVPQLGARLELSGPLATAPAFLRALAARLGPTVACAPLEPGPANLTSATLRGLARQLDSVDEPGFLTRKPDRSATILRLQVRPLDLPSPSTRPAPRRWLLAAACLLLALFVLPYLEAWVRQPRLAARLATLKSLEDRLLFTEREHGFLRQLRETRMPHLETLLVLARTVPPGTQLESFALNRQGELSLRVTLRPPGDVTGFRSRLADCGFFSSVTLEEQGAAPDRQKIQARLRAQIKPRAAWENLALLTTNDIPGQATGPGQPMPFPGSPGGPPMPMTGPSPFPVPPPGSVPLPTAGAPPPAGPSAVPGPSPVPGPAAIPSPSPGTAPLPVTVPSPNPAPPVFNSR
jgi:Tfp pilus assembly protein PilN/Tfp pilus assembly PilM family ATPase